jgi:hypothetical protein
MSPARTNKKGKAAGSCASFEGDGGGCDEEESKLSLVTGCELTAGSDPGQDFVQEKATTHLEIPHGWTRVKLEPDCWSPNSQHKDENLPLALVVDSTCLTWRIKDVSRSTIKETKN